MAAMTSLPYSYTIIKLILVFVCMGLVCLSVTIHVILIDNEYVKECYRANRKGSGLSSNTIV